MRKKYPDKVRFLLAEDVRQELGNKYSIMGVYSGDNIVLEEGPGKAIRSLAIIGIFSGGEGSFQVTAKFFGPSGQEVRKPTEINDVDIIKDTNFSFVAVIPTFNIPELGEYKILLEFQGRKEPYVYRFMVEQRKK